MHCESKFKRFDSYSFDNDQTFQQGISRLSSSPLDLEKAKHFYYSTCIEPFSLAEYQLWKSTTNGSPPVIAEKDFSQKPLNFADIAQMVARGEPIPGIRDIPDTVHTIDPNHKNLSMKPVPKPWEIRDNSI